MMTRPCWRTASPPSPPVIVLPPHNAPLGRLGWRANLILAPISSFFFPFTLVLFWTKK